MNNSTPIQIKQIIYRVLIGENEKKIKKKVYNHIDSPDDSIFKDYNKILEKANFNPFSGLCITLNHPELKTLKVTNEKEWNFLYKNNIINECIKSEITGKAKEKKYYKLYIYYKDQNIKADSDYSEITKYIMNKISPDNYITHLLNFLNERKDITNEFKLYLIKKLKDSEDNQENNNIILDTENEKKNKYILDTKKFYKILENKFNELKNFYQKNKQIEEFKSFEKIGNDFETSDETEDNSNNSIFYNKSTPIPILPSKRLDDDNFFKNPSKEEYDEEVKEIKRVLRLSFLNLKT